MCHGHVLSCLKYAHWEGCSKGWHSLHRDIEVPGELVQQSIQFLGASSCRVCSTSNHSETPALLLSSSSRDTEPNYAQPLLLLVSDWHSQLASVAKPPWQSCDAVHRIHHDFIVSSKSTSPQRMQGLLLNPCFLSAAVIIP